MPGSHSTRWIVLVLCGALSVLGCVGDADTSAPPGETGSLSLELVLADGTVINEVNWRITGNRMDMEDTIDVSADGSTASVEVYGLPPGEEDYTITLSAVSVDGDVTCEGSEDFNVEVGETTVKMVVLNCKLPRRFGSVRVNGTFNICAELLKMVVSPLVTSIGNDIDLESQGVDRDGNLITYSWSGGGGSFDDASAKSTTYTCLEVGIHLITVSVTDNDEACDMAEWTVPIECVPRDGLECIDNEDCDLGEVCVENECVPDLECIDNEDCDLGEICVENECVPDLECIDNEDCDLGEICVENECVPDLECIDDDGCDEGQICHDNTCVSDPDIICDQGFCGVDPALREECVEGFLICVVEKPNEGECVAAAALFCTAGFCDTDLECDGGFVCVDNRCVECRDVSQCPGGGECQLASCVDNSCGLVNAPDETMCMDGGGECVNGECEAVSDPVIGPGNGSTDWRALPTTATGCTYDPTSTTCSGCTITGPSVPGGGQCGQFGTPIVHGCEVPGGVLNAQLAIDVTVTLAVGSTGNGSLTHDFTVSAENPALGTAAGLVSVDAASLFASITTGIPATVQNDLNAALAGDILGEFTQGGNVLLLDSDPASVPSNVNNGVEIPTAVTPVTPTSAGSVDINYDTFSLLLTIQSSGTPLLVDDAGCIFDLPGAPITLPVN